MLYKLPIVLVKKYSELRDNKNVINFNKIGFNKM